MKRDGFYQRLVPFLGLIGSWSRSGELAIISIFIMMIMVMLIKVVAIIKQKFKYR
jgi:hypothetical protein